MAKSSNRKTKQLELKKEQSIQAVIKLFEIAGYEVRREKLKRGAGWSVQGGACAVFGEPVFFVDRNLTKDDQLDFLIGQFQKTALHTIESVLTSFEQLEEEKRDLLPEPIKSLFEGSNALVA